MVPAGRLRIIPLILMGPFFLLPSFSLSGEGFCLAPRPGFSYLWRSRFTITWQRGRWIKREVTEMLIRETVKEVRPNGNLLWASKVLWCLVDGEPIPPGELEEGTYEITPRCLPVHPPKFPPPDLKELDEWLLEFLGSFGLVFPEGGKKKNRWTHIVVTGLKAPDFPQRVRLVFQLSRRLEKGHWRITMQMVTPLRFLWRQGGETATVTGKAVLKGTFWFNPVMGIVTKREGRLSFGYTLESERWDGFRLHQTLQIVRCQADHFGELVKVFSLGKGIKG